MKKSIIAIIIIAILVGVLAGGFAIYSAKKNGNSNKSGGTNISLGKDSSIKEIDISSSEILALSGNNDLYFIGNEEENNKLKKVASNVKNFESETRYVTQDDVLHSKDTTINNIKKCDNALIAINNNDEAVLIRDLKNEIIYSTDYYTVLKGYEMGDVIEKNVKELQFGFNLIAVLKNDNTLWVKFTGGSFQQLFNDVKDFYIGSRSTSISILKNDGSYFEYSFEYSDGSNGQVGNVIANGIEMFSTKGNFYKKNDGKWYMKRDEDNFVELYVENGTKDIIFYDMISGALSDDVLITVNSKNEFVIYILKDWRNGQREAQEIQRFEYNLNSIESIRNIINDKSFNSHMNLNKYTSD